MKYSFLTERERAEFIGLLYRCALLAMSLQRTFVTEANFVFSSSRKAWNTLFLNVFSSFL